MGLLGSLSKLASGITGGDLLKAGAGIAGGLISSGSAKKAAKYQLQGVQDRIAAANANRDYQYNLNTPTINAGNDATGRIQGFLNGDATGLNQFRTNTGYQDLLNTGLKAVNANAYARGQGDSGAALKALQTRGTAIADQSAGTYLGNEFNLANLGGQARGLVAGVGGNAVAASNAATQAGADASSNSALISGNNWAKILAQLGVASGNGTAAPVNNTGSSFAPPVQTGAESYLNWIGR